MIHKFFKIKFYASLGFLLFLANCTSDSNELESTPSNNNEIINEETVIINEKEDITEEMDMSPDNVVINTNDDDKEVTQEPDNNNDTEVVNNEEVDNNNDTEVVNNDEVVTNNDDTEVVNNDEVTNNDNTNENTTEPNEPRILTQAERQQLNFATTSIFDKTSSSPNVNAKKWNTTVNLFLSGSFGNSEITFINNFANELADISPNIDLNIVSSLNQSNVEMYFATRQQYINDRPNFIQNYTPRGSAVGRANTSFRIPSFLITGRKIWADPSSRNFNSVIKHEILHILGFDHTDSPDSILFPTPNNDPTLSEDDVFTISTLYNNLINASFVESEIINTVENNIEEFFE